jgi:hypothetical protein
MLTDMTRCAYCEHPATMKIVSHPEYVCFDHAMEFWTGLLVFARDHLEPSEKHEALCTCQLCEELSASCRRAIAAAAADEELSASYRRAMAVAAAGPSPEEREDFAIRLAS